MFISNRLKNIFTKEVLSEIYNTFYSPKEPYYSNVIAKMVRQTPFWLETFISKEFLNNLRKASYQYDSDKFYHKDVFEVEVLSQEDAYEYLINHTNQKICIPPNKQQLESILFRLYKNRKIKVPISEIKQFVDILHQYICYIWRQFEHSNKAFFEVFGNKYKVIDCVSPFDTEYIILANKIDETITNISVLRAL